MNHQPNPSPPFDWEILAAAARRAPREAVSAPPGLATRVLALAQEQRRREALWFSWCLRAAFASFVLAVVGHLAFAPAAPITQADGIALEIAELVFAP
jgi:hypothetical protein